MATLEPPFVKKEKQTNNSEVKKPNCVILSDCLGPVLTKIVPFDNHFVSKFSFLSLLGQVGVSADEVETSR